MPVALVFGPEDHGLTNTDIRHCHWLMRIPTHPHYPSLNVAQAVMICLYEVFLASQTKRVRATSRDRAPTEQVEKLYDRMRETLLKIGFLNPQNPEHILLGLRRIFGRAGLGEKEVHILEGLFHQIGWYAETGPKLPTRSSAQARQKKP
jgi:tRNA/rRNA methyltransferase